MMRTVGGAPARSTFDRATHRRTDLAWLAAAWERSRVLVVDTAAGGRMLVRGVQERPRLVLLPVRQAPEVIVPARLFLGVQRDGTPLFAVDAQLSAVPGAWATNLREVGHLLTERDVELAATALALANWHAGHGYSSVSGRPTVVEDGGWSRVDDQGGRCWPRTDPAMIVLVHDGVDGPAGRCLLGNNAAWPQLRGGRRFSCLAGFVEPGESAEAAVAREVREEVGVSVEDIVYAGSQSWPFPGSLMLAFLARADAGQPLLPDLAEIAHARWFSRSEVSAALAGKPVAVGEGFRLLLPSPSSIASDLIHSWLDGCGNGPMGRLVEGR